MNRSIVFFDGECLLCNKALHWFYIRDRKQLFYFSALQSNFAKEHIPEKYKNVDSIIFLHNNTYYVKSNAALQMLALLPYWKVLGFIAKVFPTILRDYIYDWIAKNRYDWFGKTSCLLMTNEMKKRILE